MAYHKAGADGHKEINRTTLHLDTIKTALKTDVVANQLTLIRLRNTSKAFLGSVAFKETSDEHINTRWTNGVDYAQLEGHLKTHRFSIHYSEMGEEKVLMF